LPGDYGTTAVATDGAALELTLFAPVTATCSVEALSCVPIW